MATLNLDQILALGRRHGFKDAELPDLYAVVMTESRGRTDARQPGGLGRGLVQIDLGEHPNVTEAQAFDLNFAMAYARKLYLERGWAPWYGPGDRPGEAAKYRNEARSRLMTGIGGFLDDPAGYASDTAGGALDVAGGVAENVVAAGLRALFPPELVRRVVLVLAGAGMTAIGATALGFDVIKPAGSVVRRVGKAAK